MISNGPYAFKGAPNVRIKYVKDEGMALVKESALGDVVIDTYKNKDNLSPSNLSVFFMNISSEINIVSLMSWVEATGVHEMACYKVYSYTYDSKGNVTINSAVNNDAKLSGCDGNTKKFGYKNAAAIKKYLTTKFKR